MELITTHIYADLDALSSMVLAKKLYPNAVIAFPGNVSNNVKKFVTLYQDFLGISKTKDIDFDQVEKLIVVDTAKVSRIGRFSELIGKVPIEIYDHHPESDEDIEGNIVRVDYGSNTTHLLEIIKDRLGSSVHFEKYELNVALMGLYEDTGNFTYSITTPNDLKAAAFLIKKGGDLKFVHEYTTKGLREDQKETFIELLEAGETIKFSTERIFLTKLYSEEFLGGIDELINKIKDVEDCTACFIICGNDEKSNIIARSSSIGVPLDEILERYQGGGHTSASSVVVKNTPVDELYDQLREIILKNVKKGKTTKEIMSTPVKTITMETRLRDAHKIMTRFGYTGLPVVEEGKVVGIISRRDIDRSMGHGFANAPVKVYMTSKLITATEETSIDDLKQILVENEVGRIPILRGEKLVGIVTRADILRFLYAQKKRMDIKKRKVSKAMREQLLDKIPRDLIDLLKAIEKVAKKRKEKVYMVGGIVRDIILGIPNKDIDIVVEGEGIAFAWDLKNELKGKKIVVHEKFKTAVVIVSKELKIDVATSRVEYYEYPTSLPSVDYGSIREDMYRRDFTINSLALEVDYQKFGELVDFFNGYRDIQNREIRILHNFSFVEDPTRIIRAFRFASRYNFKIEEETERFLKDAVENGFLKKISWPRVKNEFKIILGDKNPEMALNYLEKYDILKNIHHNIKLTEKMKQHLEELKSLGEMISQLKLEKWIMAFLIIMEDLKSDEIELIFNKFSFSQDFRKKYEFGIGKRSEALLKLKKAEKNSEIYDILNEISLEVLMLIYLEGRDLAREKIRKFLFDLSKIKPLVTGADLISIGYKPSPEFRKILGYALYRQLDCKDITKEQLMTSIKRFEN
ncbi:CBS domain-containing protein [uncultured Ilyobacter sp.]|uniref:CBS domain-containing protein n=1 Tax=uncultured Ilyobacter sp. TaxID=544433 RepID=UPI002AA72CF1|nr:CBS domain-containing protein [uncultured Ilyobacter sp.]